MTRSRGATPRQGPDGRWDFVLDLGVGPDGRRRQARRRGFLTKREAEQELARLRVDAAGGTYVKPGRQTFGEFLTVDWLPSVRATIQPSTFESYERNVRVHVIPRLGGVPLQQLDAPMLNRFYADLLDGGLAGLGGRAGRTKSTGRAGLSPRSVRYVHTIVSRALNDAVVWGRLRQNVAKVASPPAASLAKPPEMVVWDATTLAQFLDVVAADRLGPLFLFLATSGCRRGESLGLRWGDVDLVAGKAVFRQTITSIRGQIHVANRTKTDRARMIDLDPVTVVALRTQRARQAEERLAIGVGYDTSSDLVFADVAGGPLHPERVSQTWRRRVRAHGFPLIKLHALRHGWATLALEAGVDVKIVSERLGHSSTVITQTIYQHAMPNMRTDAANRVAGLIFGNGTE